MYRGYTIEKDALKFLASLPPTPSNTFEKLCKNASPETRDLMERLLCFNPKERITVDEALRHPFFNGVEIEWGEVPPLKVNFIYLFLQLSIFQPILHVLAFTYP